MTEDLHTLAGPYALDALPEDERILFEQHLPRCVVCTAEVAEFRETTVTIGAGFATPPPVDLKAAVMASIAQVEQLPPLPEADRHTSYDGSTLHDGSTSYDRNAVAAEPVVRRGVGRRSMLALAGGVTGKVAFGITVEPQGGSYQPTMPAAVIIPMAA